jgi:hypothetical protein
MKKVVFVLGMGRSGTSALTRVVSLCGAALPELLLGPNPGNPKGHWEPVDGLNLNDELLFRYGSSWYDPSLHFQCELSIGEKDRESYLDRIGAFLSACPEARTLVVKEPRITALAELWFTAATRHGFSVGAIIPIRHPDEVTASLVARDGTSPELASALWLKYNLLAERESRSVPRVFVEYSSLLRDWRREMARIDKGLSLELEIPDPSSVDDFLESDLRHHVSSGDSAYATDAFGQGWVAKIYATLADAARDEPLNQALVDDVFRSYRLCERAYRLSIEDFAGRFGPPRGPQEAKAEGQHLKASDATDRKVAALFEQHTERDRLLRVDVLEAIDKTQSLVQRTTEHIAAQVRLQQEELQRERALLSSTLDEGLATRSEQFAAGERRLHEAIDSLKESLQSHLVGRIDRIHEESREHSSQIQEAVQRQLVECERSLEAKLRSQVGLFSAQFEVLGGQHQVSQMQLAELRSQLASQELRLLEMLRTTSEQFERRAAEQRLLVVSACSGALADIARGLEEVERSMGWRLTAPIRAIAAAFGSGVRLPHVPDIDSATGALKVREVVAQPVRGKRPAG